MAADEGRDESGPRLCCEKSLRGREAERPIDHRAVRGERLAGVKAGWSQRNLDCNIVGDLPKHFGFAHHSFVIERHDLGGYGPLHHSRDLADDLEEIATGLVNEAWVRCDAVEEAGLGELTDFGNFS